MSEWNTYNATPFNAPASAAWSEKHSPGGSSTVRRYAYGLGRYGCGEYGIGEGVEDSVNLSTKWTEYLTPTLLAALGVHWTDAQVTEHMESLSRPWNVVREVESMEKTKGTFVGPKQGESFSAPREKSWVQRD